MIGQVENQAEKRMKDVIKKTREDFRTVRTGRAHPGLVENITVDYYGTQTPLNQMANISAPEPRSLVIEPYDKSVLENVEKAIMKANLGLTPNNDGNLIRIAVPQLTEERRKELVKVVNEKAEESRIAIRNIRREANEELEMLEDEGEISEDNMHRGLDNIQDLTDQYIDRINEMLQKKEEDIMEV